MDRLAKPENLLFHVETNPRRTRNNAMLAPRVLCVLAVLAVASAVPSLNLPTEAPPHGNPTAPDGKMHSEFVAWKAKVICPPQTCLIWLWRGRR